MANETSYRDNIINGIAKEYYKTGKIKIEVTFKNGKAIKGYKYTVYGQKSKITNAHINNINMSGEKWMKEEKRT